MKSKYGLPEKVVFCRRCVMSNQRPSSSIEFHHDKNRKHQPLHINQDGICDACHFAEKKEKIDWKKREKKLLRLLDQYRSKDNTYDCIVPGSGGKDSAYAAHILKYTYGMHPLTVTWPPILYTNIGWRNFQNWINIGGFDNITFRPNGTIHRLLTKLSIENLLHPFQSFILGQKNFPPKIAMKFNIPLIFYGEHEAEYGNAIAETNSSMLRRAYYTMRNLKNLYISGLTIRELQERFKLSLIDLAPYLPPTVEEIKKSKITSFYLGYFIRWTPQENYYYAVEHTGFRANPLRSEGTFSKYSSLDDKIDGLHYYTTYIKFGLGRASYEASQEIRNKHLTRKEGIALVRRFDGEFPKLYFSEIMNYLGMKEDHFFSLCDTFRSPHLWKKIRGEWKLRCQVR